jgi:diguanylate cyclase (GGDEF)-like protein/hemerythrin-like metal-binding protein/PAS domain S-box-containing protein
MLLAVGLVVMIKEQADEVARKSQDFVQGILDSVSNQIAVLDAHGNIIAINNAWHQFAIDNSAELGQPAPQTAVGTNYLEICGMDAEVGAVAASDEAMSARDGIQAVLAGSLPSFSLEYPCHSPHEYRWFVMTVTPLRSGEKGAVVVHGNITRRKQAEHYEQIRSQALELLSENAPLERVLHVFVQGVEGFNPEMQCTIVLADPSALTAPQRVSASWSKPILAANGQPLGMFHIYHRQPTAPAQAEMAWVERFARLASIAIERSTTAQKLRASEAHFRLLTEDVSDVVWKMGADFHFTYISPADEHLRGFPASEVIGHHVFELLTDEGIAAINAAMRQRDLAEQQGPVLGPTRFEVQQRCRDGTLVWTEILSTKEIDDSGKVIGYHGITRNIAEHKATQEQVRQLAFYDVLTNLANRRLFADRLNQTIVRAQREQSRCGLLFIDLDKFKPVNDQYGHAVGDWLLQAVARRIESCLRASDTAARMGGDEFVVLLPDLQTPNDGLAVAEKIRASLLQPLLSPQGIDLGASASIGVALYPDHASTEQELLRLGDDAMYRAKKLGGNTVEWCAYASEAQGGDGMDNAAQSIVRLVWKAAFASGNAVIDREHRELFRLANVLLGHAMARLEQPEAFNAAFDTLLAHVVAHFADEEEILRRLNYGDLQEHTQLHRSLVEQAQALRQTATLEQTTVAALVDFLVTHVVAGHMLREDRKFFPLLAGEITSS